MTDEEYKAYCKTLKRDEKGRILPGQSLHPQGRKKGVSIKDTIALYLEKNPKKLAEIVMYFLDENRELMWQMMEGRPPQAVDLTHNAGDTLAEIIKNVSNPNTDRLAGVPAENKGEPDMVLRDNLKRKSLGKGEGDSRSGA